MTERSNRRTDAEPRLDVRPEIRQRTRDAARKLRTTETNAEQILWNSLRARRLRGRKFRRQQPMGPFVLDFFCAEERLAVEVDGGIHADPSQAELDIEREKVIRSLGIRVIRLTNETVLRDLPRAVQTIAAAFKKGTR